MWRGFHPELDVTHDKSLSVGDSLLLEVSFSQVFHSAKKKI